MKKLILDPNVSVGPFVFGTEHRYINQNTMKILTSTLNTKIIN